MLSIEQDVDYRNTYLLKTKKVFDNEQFWWTTELLQTKTIQERVAWWQNLAKIQSENINKKDLFHWIQSIISQLQINTSLEHCTKRQTNVHCCDI